MAVGLEGKETSASAGSWQLSNLTCLLKYTVSLSSRRIHPRVTKYYRGGRPQISRVYRAGVDANESVLGTDL